MEDQIRLLEEALLYAQSRARTSDTELNNLQEKITQLVHSIEQSLQKDVQILKYARKLLENEYNKTHNTLTEQQLFQSQKLLKEIEKSVNLLNTCSNPEDVENIDIQKICNWLKQWETGGTKTQTLIKKLRKELKQTQNTFYKEIPLNSSAEESNQKKIDSNNKQTSFKPVLQESLSPNVILSTSLTTSNNKLIKYVEDNSEEEENEIYTLNGMGIFESLNNIITKFDIFITGIINSGLRFFRILYEWLIGIIVSDSTIEDSKETSHLHHLNIDSYDDDDLDYYHQVYRRNQVVQFDTTSTLLGPIENRRSQIYRKSDTLLLSSFTFF